MDVNWWIVLVFLGVVVAGSTWLWHRANEYDDYINETDGRERRDPPAANWPGPGGGSGL